MHASAAETLERIRPILARCLGLGSTAGLEAGTTLADLTMDSVVILEMLLAVEQEFQIQIDAQDLLQAEGFRTLGSLAEYVQRQRGNAT